MPASAQLLVILVALVAFWAIVMRPARNQQKKVHQLQQELSVGQEVILSAGIFGTIRSLSDTRAEIEVAPGVVLTVARQVVVRRVDELEESGPVDRGTEAGEDTPRDTDGPASGPTQAQD